MTGEDRQALVILGMHRSGTSALAGLCTRLGAAPPARMLAPAADNPRGFWESRMVMGVLDSLLKATGHSWYDCLTFGVAEVPDAMRAALQAQLAETLEEEFGDAPCYVLKDPRLCVSAEIWRPVLPATRALLMLRHPTEVARSLEARDAFTRELSLALWLHHMLEAEAATRTMRRGFVTYDGLLADWRGMLTRAGAAAGIAWPVSPATADLGAEDLLDTDLRHHAEPAEAAIDLPGPIGSWVERSWFLLREVGSLGPDPDFLAELDAIRAAFALWRDATTPRVRRRAA
ncbi:MAG: hypothetical protein BGO51_11770 [Rhodospirillales bacterium 69-11]|nr:sulfotransferase [Rhodospirillales bacterium]OJW23210.1 MAG: hypothetical protein BGO51_11770 [Rhodospirillales bacterium 69-11]